jgi:4-hydroxy-3-methylbut-2-enyl diphosphate reductase
MVADYIVNGGDKEAFLKHFEKAISKGFDPDVHLKKIGLANQTTMYKKETRAIGQLFQKAMMKKYGPVEASNHYTEFDTICDATQVRSCIGLCDGMLAHVDRTCVSDAKHILTT